MCLIFCRNCDLPNRLFCILLICLFVAFGIAGLLPMRGRVRRQHNMHPRTTVSMSILIGLLVFLIGTLDNPFHNEVSVGPDALLMDDHQAMNVG